MPELTLHFETISGTDTAAAALEVQKQLAAVNGIQSVAAKAQRFQGVGPAEILAGVKFATELAQSTTGLLMALAGVYAAWQKAKVLFPGLRPPTVEVGLQKIPVDQVTAEHVEKINSDA